MRATPCPSIEQARSRSAAARAGGLAGDTVTPHLVVHEDGLLRVPPQ